MDRGRNYTRFGDDRYETAMTTPSSQTTSQRDDWHRHANVGGPARMMLHIHERFRRASAELLAEAARVVPDRARMRIVFGELASVLHRHHHAEEVLLFPRLVDAGVAAEALESDHRRLLSAIATVEDALKTRADARAPLREFDALLRSHLDAEEAVSIPYLLEHPWL
jgi:hypothetical protein